MGSSAPPPLGRRYSRVTKSTYIQGLGVHLLGVNENKKLSPDQGHAAMQLFPSNSRGVFKLKSIIICTLTLLLYWRLTYKAFKESLCVEVCYAKPQDIGELPL
jgi:hypothetical protein